MKLTRRGLGHLLIRSHHSFACFALLASLACSAALICSLARLITYSGAHGKDIFVYELNASISYSLNSLCTITIPLALTMCGRVPVTMLPWGNSNWKGDLCLWFFLISVSLVLTIRLTTVRASSSGITKDQSWITSSYFECRRKSPIKFSVDTDNAIIAIHCAHFVLISMIGYEI